MADSKTSYWSTETFISVAAAFLFAGAILTVVGSLLAKKGAHLTGVNPDGSNFDGEEG